MNIPPDDWQNAPRTEDLTAIAAVMFAIGESESLLTLRAAASRRVLHPVVRTARDLAHRPLPDPPEAVADEQRAMVPESGVNPCAGRESHLAGRMAVIAAGCRLSARSNAVCKVKVVLAMRNRVHRLPPVGRSGPGQNSLTGGSPAPESGDEPRLSLVTDASRELATELVVFKRRR
jgi:hypothetical protein